MHFDKAMKKRTLNSLPNIFLDRTEVEVVHKFKYLRVWSDNRLCISEHMFKMPVLKMQIIKYTI